MYKYKETETLAEFAKEYQRFEAVRNLDDLEDLEVYIYSIKNRFFEKEQFPQNFIEGYELIRKHAEGQEQQTKKYSRENYIQGDDD